MWPYALGIRTYSLLLALGIAVGVAIALVSARQGRFATGSHRGFGLILAVSLLTSLFGAKLHSLVERGTIAPLWWELSHGYRYPGAVIFAGFVLLVVARVFGVGRLVLSFGDIAAPAGCIALVVARVGCFLAGCCHGTVSHLLWAVVFPAESYAWEAQLSRGLIRADATAALPVHPLQLYFAVWLLTLGIFLFWLRGRRAYVGQVLLTYLALDNLMKFLLEHLRDPAIAHLQWTSLAIAVTAVGVMAAVRFGGALGFSAGRVPGSDHGVIPSSGSMAGQR